MKKKTIALLLALTLVLGVTTGGTLAWLLDTTEEVENVFTTSDVDIELNETTTDYQMIPGYTIAKDPTVTVKAVSEKCYVFVKVEKSATKYTVGTEQKGFVDYLTYTIDSAWTSLDGVAGVYYKVFENTETDRTQAVLADNQVQVKDTVTKEMMNAIKTEADRPTLTFTAYACQLMKNNTVEFTPAEAWANVNSANAG